MKIRNGFVSNSSSSSFCIMYKKVDMKNIDEDDIYMLSECWDGLICFKLTKEMKEYLKKQVEEDRLPRQEYELIKMIYYIHEGGRSIKTQELIDKLNKYENINILNTESSINAPYDIDAFMDWYEE